MNILIVTPLPIDTTSFYRAWGVFPNLVKRMGKHHNLNITLLSDKGRSMTWVDLTHTDLIYLHRPFTMEQLKFSQYAKEMNVPIWVDYDDDLTSIPIWMSFYDTYMNAMTQKIMADCIALADVVTASTDALAAKLKRFNPMVITIPNALNDDLLSIAPLPYSEQKIVMWRGSETHHVDLMEFSDAIKGCITREDWEWMYFGYNPWFMPKTKHIPIMDPVMYFRTIRSINPAVMFVPLVDDEFNRCKSNINWLESTLAGSVTLVPGWESWEQPGSFKYKDKTEFEEKLKYLMSGESYFERKAAYEASWDYIRENLTLSVVNKQRIDIIEMLVK